MLGRLLMEVGASTSWGYGGVPMALNIFINTRIDTTIRKIQRIAEQIRAGTYRLRSSKPRKPISSEVRRPPRPPPLVEQKFGWLLPLLPMPYWNANGYRAGVESALEDPEMIALIQAAPVTLGRPLRSLCWMFRIKPPPIPPDAAAGPGQRRAPAAAIPATTPVAVRPIIVTPAAKSPPRRRRATARRPRPAETSLTEAAASARR
jgi:hypothetical protein